MRLDYLPVTYILSYGIIAITMTGKTVNNLRHQWQLRRHRRFEDIISSNESNESSQNSTNESTCTSTFDNIEAAIGGGNELYEL
jgi:hypothetical protein